LWNEYVERFHPLGYRGAFGYRLRYFIRAGAQPLGCILLAGAAKAIAVRDRWIGWDAQARLCNLARVINTRARATLRLPQCSQTRVRVVGPTFSTAAATDLWCRL
jgi:hypothetical protein